MEVKGTAIVVVPAFIKDRYQESGFEKWLQALTAEARKVYAEPVIISRWYDTRVFLIEPTVKFCELFYQGDLRGAYELGRYSADYALRGIYRLFVKLGSVEFILKKAKLILPTYYRPSSIEVPVMEKGRALIRITEFADIHEVVEQRIAGWIARAAEISGGKNVKLEITSTLTRGQAYSEFTVTWS